MRESLAGSIVSGRATAHNRRASSILVDPPGQRKNGTFGLFVLLC